MHRFRWKRRRAALALLPALAMMVTAGIAGASAAVPAMSGSGPEATAAGGHCRRAISTGAGHRNVMAGHRAVKFRGRVSPGGQPGDRADPGRRAQAAYARPGRRLLQGPLAGAGAPASTARGRSRGRDAGSVALAPGRGSTSTGRPRPRTTAPACTGAGLACGGTLSPGKLGVANKTLPCGARVTLRYHGTHGHRPRDRPGALRGQPRVRPDRGHQGEARVPARRGPCSRRARCERCSRLRRRATRLMLVGRAGLGALRRSASPAKPTPTSRTGAWGSKRSSSSRAIGNDVSGVAGVGGGSGSACRS